MSDWGAAVAHIFVIPLVRPGKRYIIYFLLFSPELAGKVGKKKQVFS